MLEVLGFIVLVIFGLWYSMLCYGMVCYGGLDCSPFWSKYYNQGSNGVWNRIIAVIMCSLSAGLWYWIFTLSPFVLELKQ